MLLPLLLLLYMVQGIPYGFQSRFLPIYLRTHGLSLSILSSLKLLYTPWLLKTLWAPLVDAYRSKRWWLIVSMSGLLATCLGLGCLEPTQLWVLAGFMATQNLLASLQDIAVDAFAIVSLSPSQLGSGNVAQVVGYKLGAVLGGGCLVTLADWLPWSGLFVGLAAIYAAAIGVVAASTSLGPDDDARRSGPDNKIDGNKKSSAAPEQALSLGAYARTLSSALRSGGSDTASMAGLVLLYKLGEQGALGMLPLFLVDRGVSLGQVGFWTGVVGQVTSVLGSALGGPALARWPARSVLLACCCVRLPLLCGLAACASSGVHGASDMVLPASVLLMNASLLVSGLITTSTFALMMRCSQTAPPACRATHYTGLATLEVLGKLIFSSASGVIVDGLGYGASYVLFLVLAALVPAYLHRYVC
ncbi:hypothetical protein BOX15_Mlig018921g3 [Macrostomum lignano]|uniref:Uncharacterized protein n=2 Tax=Macrostomum lignano TaxID=282301 RepID=A0A267E4I8_9PLAT|nr:hypothetical protein BOX15_Mlig018921g3 [Macrostomum lignano]